MGRWKPKRRGRGGGGRRGGQGGRHGADRFTTDPDERVLADHVLGLVAAKHAKWRARALWLEPGGGIQEFILDELLRESGHAGLLQLAAVLSRVAEPDQYVAIAGLAIGHDKSEGLHLRPGSEDGYMVFVAGWAKSGRRFWHPLRVRQVGRREANITTITTADPLPERLDEVRVDPYVDDLLARNGTPGAIRGLGLQEHEVMEAPITSMKPTASGGPGLPPLENPRPQWQSLSQHMGDLSGLLVWDFMPEGQISIRTAPPINWKRRTVQSLVAGGWISEEQSVILPHRIPDSRGAEANVATLCAHPEATERLRLHAHMMGMHSCAARGELEPLVRLGASLTREVDAALERAGGLSAWLVEQWPDDADFQHRLGLVGLCGLAADAHWRVALAPYVFADVGQAHEGDRAAALAIDLAALPAALERGLAYGRRVRDALLSRAGAPDAPDPGERIARLSRQILGVTPSASGEHRGHAWWDGMGDPKDSRPVAELLRYHAAYRAARLHSQLIMCELGFAATWPEALAETCRPASAVPSAGLMTPLPLLLARHLVLEAARDVQDSGRAITLLERASELSPDHVVRVISLEGRFRLGDRTSALGAALARLARKSPDSGVAAAWLRVAEHQGDARGRRLAHRALLRATEAGPHAWAARVVVLLGRANERADDKRVAALCDPPALSELDPGSWVVFALYGPEPQMSVTRWRQALEAQRLALEHTSRLRLTRLERRATTPPRARRPEVPAAPADGALHVAVDALWWRLTRPGMATSPHKDALWRHARAARRLAETTPAEAAPVWLLAVGDLVAAVDAELRGGADASTETAAALLLAEAALATVLRAAWLQATFEALGTIRPAAYSGRPGAEALIPRLEALERRAAALSDADDPVQRDAVDRAVRELLFDGVIPPGNTAPAAGSTDEDDFAPMTMAPGAMDRSRQLGTPDWALSRGLTQIHRYNLAGGHRDLKKLKGITTADDGGLWELRHHSARSAVRIVYRLTPTGPRALAIMLKENDAQQSRLLERIAAGSV